MKTYLTTTKPMQTFRSRCHPVNKIIDSSWLGQFSFSIPVVDDNLHYIAVKPSASVSQLRQKVWHLLDLPDFCEEIIILKTENDHEIPLTELRKGNEPQHPYIMEVWLPGKKSCKSNKNKYLIGIDNLDADGVRCSHRHELTKYIYLRISPSEHFTVNLFGLDGQV